MSFFIRKHDFVIWEIRGADQLLGNRQTDQRLWFWYCKYCTIECFTFIIQHKHRVFYNTIKSVVALRSWGLVLCAKHVQNITKGPVLLSRRENIGDQNIPCGSRVMNIFTN